MWFPFKFFSLLCLMAFAAALVAGCGLAYDIEPLGISSDVQLSVRPDDPPGYMTRQTIITDHPVCHGTCLVNPETHPKRN